LNKLQKEKFSLIITYTAHGRTNKQSGRETVSGFRSNGDQQ
jgi:hypothetical protein